MKIVFFGNTNNYPYILARAMRELGHEVILLVNRKAQLHRPESMEQEFLAGYPSWIEDVSDIEENAYSEVNHKVGRVLDIMAGSDGIILNDIGPSLLGLVNKPAISILTGSDLDYYADYASLGVRQKGWESGFMSSPQGRRENLLWADFVRRQRLGILMSQAVSYFPRGTIAEGDRLLDEIGIDNKKRIFIYMANLPVVSKIDLSTKPALGKTVRIFCGTRLTWKKPIRPGATSLDYKGMDIMIKGLGIFVKKHPGLLDIRIVKKGWDVSETQLLAEEEGVDPFVTWINEMCLRDYYNELCRADIVFDQLGESCIGMAGADAMAMGKPLIANGRPELFSAMFEHPLPVCQATNQMEVYRHIERLVFDTKHRKSAGNESREFARRFLSPEYFANKCSGIFSVDSREL